jgi:hypothetical protein
MLDAHFQLDIQRIDLSKVIGQHAESLRRQAPGRARVAPIGIQLPLVDKSHEEQHHRFTYATRVDGERWWVLRDILGPETSEEAWSFNRSSEMMGLPLYPYLIPDSSPEVLVQFGAQTAALAFALFPRGYSMQRYFLAVGNVFQRPDAKPGYQCWMGFAARVKE